MEFTDEPNKRAIRVLIAINLNINSGLKLEQALHKTDNKGNLYKSSICSEFCKLERADKFYSKGSDSNKCFASPTKLKFKYIAFVNIK